MSRRNTDAITIHSILDWIEDNLESPLSLEKVSERSGYSKWHLQRMFKKETGHSLGQSLLSWPSSYRWVHTSEDRWDTWRSYSQC